MVKRAAVRAGEVGLFISAEPFEEDFSHIKTGTEVQVKATQPRSLRQHKYAWALATKVAEACDWLETKDDAMDFMLIEAKHFRRIYDPLRKVAHLKPKPTNWGAMDGIAYTALLKRMKHVVTHLIIPGLLESDLVAEIEKMIGSDFPQQQDPEPAKPTRRNRSAPRKPAEPAGEDADKGGDAPNRVSDGESYSVAPADSPPPEGRPEVSGPTNEAEYIQACLKWLQKQTNRFEAFDYFNGEVHRKMRFDLKISTGTRKALERQIGEFFDEQDKARTAQA